ncbi:MAG: DUF998 domain-containing protein [Humibacillus sp.]|nr:DUF998 domain-containing protein [Humibacillus sp.]MDN5777362.1 DUF998 domain-containing protein [Humibacillus sp.]
MTTHVPPPAASPAVAPRGCRADRVTKSLLGWGVIAGPLYVGVSLIEATVRPGFDLTRHSWSLLSNGPYGWVHATLLVLTGLMTIAAALGFRRALALRAVPVLLGLYGAGLLAAGLCTADPADGFPVGTAAGPGVVSGHGLMHLAAAGTGFLAFSAATVTLGVHYLRRSQRGRGLAAISTGVLFLTAFVGVAAGGGKPTVVAFVAAVIVACSWLTVTSITLYRDES